MVFVIGFMWALMPGVLHLETVKKLNDLKVMAGVYAMLVKTGTGS